MSPVVSEPVSLVSVVVSVLLFPPSVPTVPSGPMVVFSGDVGRWVVCGTVVVAVVGVVVGRVTGAVVVIWVAADVSLPLPLRQAVNIATVRTSVNAIMLNRFIVILLFFLGSDVVFPYLCEIDR